MASIGSGIARVRVFLSWSNTEVLMHAFSLPKSNMSNRQLLQNLAALVLMRARKALTFLAPCLFQDRSLFQVLVLVFKHLNHLRASDSSDLFFTVPTLMDSDLLQLTPTSHSKCKNKNPRWGILVMSLSMAHSLPESLRAETVNVFKSRFKILLFKLAFK